MPRIDGRRDRRPEIDIAETENEIAGVEDGALYGGDAVEAIDAADEFDVVRAPGCVGPHQLLIFQHRQLRVRIVPAER